MPKKKITLSSSGIKVNICIECKTVAFDRKKITGLVRRTAGRFGIKKAKINIAVLTDRQIINMNRRFLGRRNTTDVISFDVSDDGGKEKIFDIAVNAQLAKKQAKIRGHSPQAELALYILHGLLHNFGFDDTTSRKAVKMHKTEDEILKKFGFGAVYDTEKR
ncbi:MAG: rRNA maturation RNase YbeY [Planctomycetes bacterium HGW-Planctomycetes-1]|nr:MAG: rRNA maturation RNase YbeY [Planctomycetes bacterium HGW-Planctomycetes-1]